MAALLDTRRTTQGQSPEPQVDGSPQATLPERNWNPLLVPTEMYLREGLVWQPQQPVSLTVEVNGKRDLMKYAAVMQLVPKLGFIARLGQPGAAAKFQNLHLVDVKRRGSTDVHICLGDLAWTRSRASEASVTALLAPSTMPSSGAASPDISDAAVVAPEACVIGGGAAEGGLLSGSSSEGTTTAQAGGRSSVATGIDVDAGDSRSHGDAASDHDEKATMTSAVGRSADAQTSSSAAAATAPLVGTIATAVAASVVSGDAGAAGTPAPSAAATALSYRCDYVFCPCHLDQLDASPHGSVVADRQTCFGRSSTPASGRPSCVAGPAADLPGAHQPSPVSDASAGGGLVTHMSRERLRNLCLPAMRRSASSVALPKATVTGPSDGGRAGGLATLPSIASASLPPLRAVQGSSSASAAAGGIWVGGGVGAGMAAAPGAGGVVVAGHGLIDRELVLPAELAAKRMMDKHALVQFEIDGEFEDCRVQYRLVRSDDGRTLTLQGISRPLRGLQLLSLSEAADGDLFIRAATPCAAPSGGAFANAPMAALALAAAMPPAASAAAAAVGSTAAAAADTAPMLSRSSGGRQRRPSLKAREGAEEAVGTGFGAGSRTASAGSAPALTSLYPMQSASGEPLASAVLQQLQIQKLQQQQQQQLVQQSVQQSKRRGRPPKSRLPSSPPPLPRYPQQQLLLQQQFHQQQRLPSSAYTTGGEVAMGEQMEDSHDGYDDHTLGFGGSAKRSRTAAAAGRAASSSMASQDGTSVQEEHDDAAPEGRRGAPQRGRRSVAPAAPPPAPLRPVAFAPGGGATAVALVHGRARNTFNTGSAPSLPPLVILNRGEVFPQVKTSLETDDEAFGGQQPQRQQAWQQQQQPHAGPACAARASALADIPTGGRGVRKRASAASSGPAAAGVAVAKAPVEPSPKRVKPSRGDSFQGVMAADGGSGDDAQPLLQLQRESPQGSEAAAAAAPVVPRGRSSNTRAVRAARRAQPLSRRLVSCPPSLSSSDDDSTGADEADGGERPGGKSSAAAAGAGAGEDIAAGAEGGDALSYQAAAQQQMGTAAAAAAAAGAAASRHKPRGRVNTSKSKGKSNRHPSKISNVIRNAGAILLMIGHSPMVYEKQLRATFGNNPDTSKALRLLEEQGKVMRGGLGYRMHPYHYTLTPVGREEYERLLAEKGPSHAFAVTMGVGLPSGSDEDSPAAGEGEEGDDDAAAAGEDDEAVGEAGASAAVAEGGAAVHGEMETEAQSEAVAAVPQQQLKQDPHAAPMLMTGFCGMPQPASAGESAGPSAMQVDYPGRGAATAAAAAAVAGPTPQPSGTCESGSSRQQPMSITAAVLPPARPLLPQLSTATGAPGGSPVGGGAAAAAAGGCAGGGGSSSPSASTHSVQLFHQAPPVGGGAAVPEAAAMVGGLVPTSGSSAGTLAAPPQPQQPHPQQQVLLLQLHPTHPHAMSAAAGDQQKQFTAAGNVPVSATLLAGASAAAPAAANAGAAATAPQQLQAMYACPVGYQLSYSQAYQLVPQDGVKPEQDPTAQAAASQVPYGNPYAVYGYVPTPFGYMPCAMYSAYAPAGGGGAAAVAGGGVMPAPLMAAPGGMAVEAAAASGAQSAAVMSAPSCTPAYMQPYAAMAFPPGGQPPAAAGAQAPLAQTTLPAPLPSQLLQQQQQQQHEPQQQQLPALMTGVPVVVPPAPPQPKQQQQHQAPSASAVSVQQQQPPLYRYVVETPGGGWRAEVPSAAGVLYYSPGFASGLQAAAAADLLMSKLRPGEQLNLGINPQEEATLSSWSVEQVQATLWNMADQR